MLAVGGACTFCMVEWDYYYKEKQRERNLTSSYEDTSDTKYSVTKTHSASTLNDEEGFVSDASAY